jgi:hypothetical protein
MIDQKRHNPWYVSGVLCAAIVLLFAVAAATVGSNDLLHWFMIPVLLCGIVIGADAASWITGEVDVFDPIGILGLFGVHFFLLAPMLHVSCGYWAEETQPPADWRPWLGAMAALNLLGLLVYRFARAYCGPGRPSASPVAAVWRVRPGAWGWWFGGALLLAGALQAWIYASYGGLWGYVSAVQRAEHSFLGSSWIAMVADSFPILAWMGYAILLRRRPAPSWPTLLCALAVFAALKLLFGGLHGSRSNTIFALFWAVGIVHLCIRPVPKKLILGGTAMLVLFMYVYGFYKSGGMEGLQRALESSDARAQMEEETHRPLRATVLGDLGRSDIQAAVLYRLTRPQSDYQLGLGRSYLGGLLTILPGPLWRDRPPTKVREGTEALYGRGSYRERPLNATYDKDRFLGMSVAVYGLAGEAMLNFGPLAAPFSFAVLGLAVGRVRRWAAAWRRRDVRWLLMPFLVNLCLVVLIGDSDNVVAFVMGAGLIPTLVLAMASQRLWVNEAPGQVCAGTRESGLVPDAYAAARPRPLEGY